MQVSQNLKMVWRGRVFRCRGGKFILLRVTIVTDQCTSTVQSIPSTSKKKYYLLSEAQLKKLHDDDTEMLACLDECDRYIDQVRVL